MKTQVGRDGKGRHPFTVLFTHHSHMAVFPLSKQPRHMYKLQPMHMQKLK
jgi:hypothetical protein